MATSHGRDENGKCQRGSEVDRTEVSVSVEDRRPADINRDVNEADDNVAFPGHVASFCDLDKEEFLQQQIDEGCVIDMDEAAQTYGQYPLTEDTLPPATKMGFINEGLPDDSGFSSRMSEDSASLRKVPVKMSELKKAVVVADLDDKDNGESCKVSTVLRGVVKFLGVLLLLYVFICSLDLLSNAFRLLGGKTAGSVFQDNALLENPITGLMIGVLATVILQSSSTSSSIVITMVSSGILDVRPAIPIIMGANIGTTVTNTLVSLAHAMDPKEFRRAFSGATVHDVFNWLTVLILLPLEHFTGYLYHLTLVIVDSLNMEELRTKKQDLLKQLTKPLTKRIVQVDKKVITQIAEGKADPEARLLKLFCVFNETETVVEVNKTLEDGNITLVNETFTSKIGVGECESLLSVLGLSDMTSGILLFVFSLVLLSGCLYLMVKLLHSMLGSQVARMAKKTINANFPGRAACLTDYFALVVGAGMTILVQSSSVFTSALTPLVGVGCLKLERMYPLTLGSNIGTTATGILAALASSSATMKFALQLAMCHLFFNITGILLFFPIPITRRFPLRVARFLGRTTARYRWFAVFYLLMMFLVFPGFFLTLSFLGNIIFITVLTLVAAVTLAIVVISTIQRSRFVKCLPSVLRTWKWLPLCLRSLQPLDNLFRAVASKICCQPCLDKCKCLGSGAIEDSVDRDSIDSDSEDSDSDSSVGVEVADSESSCLCCCRPRGVQKVQQSEQAADMAEAATSHHLFVWSKRTHSPIYKPSLKAHQPSPSPSTVPLITIPESVV